MGALIILAVFAVMWAVLILPQQRKARRHRELVASLDKWDEVITSAGIYGTITEIDGEVIYLEVVEGIELKVARSSIAEKVQQDEEPEAPEADQSGDDESVEELADNSDD